MASARKIEDETEARRCLRAAKLAGYSAGEWARAHGIDGRSLNSWKVASLHPHAATLCAGSCRQRDGSSDRPG